MAFQSIRKSLPESVESSSRNIAWHFFCLRHRSTSRPQPKPSIPFFFTFASTSVKKKIAKLKIIPVFLENVYRFLSVKQSHSLKALAATQHNSQNNPVFLTALTTNQDVQYFQFASSEKSSVVGVQACLSHRLLQLSS